MKNTLNILKVSSVLMALTLCIGVSYPLFAHATEVLPITVIQVVPGMGSVNDNSSFGVDTFLSPTCGVTLNDGGSNWNASWAVTNWSSSAYNAAKPVNGTYTFTGTFSPPTDDGNSYIPEPGMTFPLTCTQDLILTGASDGTSGTPTLGGSNGTDGTSGTPTLGGSNGTGGTSGVPTLGGSNGNESVTDTTPPVISGTPSDISTTTDGASVVVNYTPPTALDAVSGTVSVSCVPPSGSSFNVGTTQVICTATDAAHNSASTTFDVIVTAAAPSPVVETDICPNIAEVQTSIPSGMILDSSGNCVAQNNGGGGSSGSYSSGGSSIVPLALSSTNGTTTPITTCPLITTYMKFGGINNPTDVAKLQAFLKNSQGLDVTVNGTFDQQMENAVRAFQSKYMSQIMGPWGANQSSGYVYITTLKKVNEIACNTPLTLSPAELAIINAYKNSQAAGTNAGPTVPGAIVIPGTLNIPGTTNTGTTPPAPIIGQNGTSSNANVAAVGSFAGAWNNFWGSVWKSIIKIF